MCFNAKTSITTFLIGLIGSLGLIYYGNKKYIKENVVTGIFFIFIAFIQLMDFLFWIDIKNKMGINKIVTILGPIFNVGQPVILYIIKIIYLLPKNRGNLFSLKDFNLEVLMINIVYLFLFIYNYIQFLQNSKLITGTFHGHLNWPWLKYSNANFYLILLAINIFYLLNFNYALIVFLITYFCLFLSYTLFYYNTGELWCFFGAFIPIILIGITYLI
jgi:hypothetical protein